jgi:hypothetical protein
MRIMQRWCPEDDGIVRILSNAECVLGKAVASILTRLSGAVIMLWSNEGMKTKPCQAGHTWKARSTILAAFKTWSSATHAWHARSGKYALNSGYSERTRTLMQCHRTETATRAHLFPKILRLGYEDGN